MKEWWNCNIGCVFEMETAWKKLEIVFCCVPVVKIQLYNNLHLVEGSNSAIAKLAIAFLIHFLWICICEAMASDMDKFYWHWEDIRFLTHIKKETKYKWPKIGILISGKIKVTVDVR